MISKHLLISIFLVTSLFAGSKTKRDKGKSDSKPSSDDSKDIVHKSKWTPREGKLDGEGGKKEDAADEAGVSTEGGNETPKVNRLMENAGESDEEAEHPEGSQREESQGAQEEEEGEEEEAENDEVLEEDRLDEEEGEEYEPKEDDAEPKKETEKEEPKREAEKLDDEGKSEEDEPKGESPRGSGLHKDDEPVVEEPKVETEVSDVDEPFSSGAEAPENVDVGDGVDASASPAVETPSSPAETTKYHYSTTKTGWEGFKNRDQIEVNFERNGEWYKATILNLQSKPKGTLRIRYENCDEEVINVKTQATIRKRI